MKAGLVAGLTFLAALFVAVLVRGNAALGIAVLFLVFVPIEKLFALRPQRVFRRGLLTDLTHLLVNNLFVTAGTLVLVVAALIPLFWIRSFGLANFLPVGVAIPLALVIALVGNYWGHRLTHQVPFLWRFHSVHHSIELMDWVAAGRLHPLDSAFTQAFTVLPLVLLGYEAGVFAGVAVFVTLLAIFQHANVRLRFPVVRWVINTPEWHHWHHAIDDQARDKNFGLPVIDRMLAPPTCRRASGRSGSGSTTPCPKSATYATSRTRSPSPHAPVSPGRRSSERSW